MGISNVELEKLVKLQGKVIDDLQGRLAMQEKAMADTRLELKTAISSEATATLRAVTSFYQTVDNKLTEFMTKVNVKFDIIETDKFPAMENTLANHKEHITALDEHVGNPNTSAPPTKPQEVDSTGTALTMKGLESRIDQLENYSRRDNLLFYGFDEDKNEDCLERVKNIIINKILPDDPNAKNIRFVRVHRLGRYNRNFKRPIIARFVDYNAKTAVLMNSRNLVTPYGVSEDFCLNTKNLRQEIHKYVKIAKAKLKDTVKSVYVKFKVMAMRQLDGKLRTYTLNDINTLTTRHPYNWWEYLFSYNARDKSSESDVPNNITPLIDTRDKENTPNEEVDTLGAEGDSDPHLNGDISTHVEHVESVVEEEIAPLDNGDNSPHIDQTEEEGEEVPLTGDSSPQTESVVLEESS